MKKALTFSSLVILAAMVTAPVKSEGATSFLTTDGTVGFTADNNETGPIVKPDETGNTQEEIEISEGKSGSGALRIQFVPNFNFGKIDKITSDNQQKNVQLLSYTEGSNNGEIVPFVQVTNNSGENTNWDLTVKATEFKTTDNEVLTGAYISLNESTLTSTGIDSAAAGALVSSFQTGKIPTDGTGTLSILSAKSGAVTNGKHWSNVFHKDYVKDQVVAADAATGVTFVKPAGIAASAKEYTSTLTWTLSDGK